MEKITNAPITPIRPLPGDSATLGVINTAATRDGNESHSLRGTIGSIANVLAAEILCDWALVSASKALEQSRFEFAHDQERRASDEAIIAVTADYNVSSIFSIGGAAPHKFFEPSVREPLTFEVTIKCFVQSAWAGGLTPDAHLHKYEQHYVNILYN